jgi:isocitrate dehydrogenase
MDANDFRDNEQSVVIPADDTLTISRRTGFTAEPLTLS